MQRKYKLSPVWINLNEPCKMRIRSGAKIFKIDGITVYQVTAVANQFLPALYLLIHRIANKFPHKYRSDRRSDYCLVCRKRTKRRSSSQLIHLYAYSFRWSLTVNYLLILNFLLLFFEFFDFRFFFFQISSQKSEDTHVNIRDPDQWKTSDQQTLPARRQEVKMG